MNLCKKAAVATFAVAMAPLAAAQVTLPELGVDIPGTATAMGTDLGAIFTAVVGISAVFIAGKIGWRWLRRAGA